MQRQILRSGRAMREYEERISELESTMEELSTVYDAKKKLTDTYASETRGPIKTVELLSRPKTFLSLSQKDQSKNIQLIYDQLTIANRKLELLESLSIPEDQGFFAQKEQILKHGRVAIGYEEKISKIENFVQDLSNKYERKKRITDIYIHDAGRPMMTTELISKPQKFLSSSLEVQAKKIEAIYGAARIANYRLRLLELSNMSREELLKFSERIQIADLAEIYSKGTVEEELIKHKITLNLKYNGYMGEPISAYGHPGAFGSVFENIYGGMLDFALPKSKTKLGIGIREGKLEIMAENKHFSGERLRRVAGEARGLGLPSIKEFVNALEGTVELYEDKKINRCYNKCTKVGYTGEIEKYPRIKTFGIKIKIPIKNLEEN
jgi:hypothetical protein